MLKGNTKQQWLEHSCRSWVTNYRHIFWPMEAALESNMRSLASWKSRQTYYTVWCWVIVCWSLRQMCYNTKCCFGSFPVQTRDIFWSWLRAVDGYWQCVRLSDCKQTQKTVPLPAAESRHFRTIYSGWSVCFRLYKRIVNTSSIAFYRLNQPSLTIFVLAVTVLSLLKNDPAMMTVTTSPACYFMISIDSQFDLNYRYFSAWLCVYHCYTERCVIRICINYLPSTQTNQTFVCRTWSQYTTTATKIKTIFLLISKIKISWFRTSAVFPRKWSQNIPNLVLLLRMIQAPT